MKSTKRSERAELDIFNAIDRGFAARAIYAHLIEEWSRDRGPKESGGYGEELLTRDEMLSWLETLVAKRLRARDRFK